MPGRNARTILRRVLFAAFMMLEIYIGWKNFQEIAATENAAGEPVAEWERRFAPLKKIMPFTHGTVGYVSDSGVTGIDYYNPNDQIEYTLTQYVMAPLVVRKGVDHEWIIGNFSKQGYEDWRRSNPGSFDVIALSYGVYLIHRLPQ
jgi:thiosulfate reductase cytochrome b subunit